MSEGVQDPGWPRTRFSFSVTLGDDASVHFQEVDGLETETQTQKVEYRHGNSPVFDPVKMPGVGRTGSVTLRKGVFVHGSRFWQWCTETGTATIERRAVVIRLLDEQGNPTMSWTLDHAWPAKITGMALEPEGTEVAVESLELAYEALTVTA